MTTSSVLTDHIALISGAGGDIGRGVAVAYAKAGATLVLVDKDQKGLEKTDDAVKAAGGAAALVVLDLTDIPTVAGLGPALLERYGRLDSVTACHGARSTPTPLGHITTKEWNRILPNNITATWQLIQMSTPLLTLSEDARFLMVTSSHATETPAFNASYNVAKAGVEAVVKTFQAETANAEALQVALVNPGDLLTRSRRVAYPYQKAGEAAPVDSVTSQFVALLAQDTPLAAEITLHPSSHDLN